ncbi:MAG: YgiQ family radical SAM protein [Lentisphaerae bacterium]|jgi:uncharacterized radical SAM protein YgiQ|nr:YgiQ family radical SAM protein [Lentisphaerota bacterium]
MPMLPMTKAEMAARGWQELDILLISGDAYVDHPSFGTPLLGRLLEANGYRVGIIAQPRWDTPEDIARLGRPRLFCSIGSGGLDSMLCHYTAFRKKRRDDAFTPGGKAGARPNRASIVYANLVRAAFPGIFLALGGIEASLRRAAHYDFWSDSLRRSLIFDAKADIILYGMAEKSILELARRLRNGESPAGIPGTARISDQPEDAAMLPSYEDILAKPTRLLEATLAIEEQVHHAGPRLAQPHGKKLLLLEPPQPPLSQAELDSLYSLPFTRQAHPSYSQPIPALDMVQWSITAVRGCAGGCAFCSLALHQGRRIVSRSPQSLAAEISALTKMPGWRGTVSDVGGPTANFWNASCRANPSTCRRRSCLTPKICPHFDLKQKEYLQLLRQLKKLPGVKHLGIASGIRHDAALQDPDFVDGLAAEFVSGQLKLAPEHAAPAVTTLMRKPDFSLFERFCKLFTACSRKHGKEQYVVPYIMSAYPGCTMADMQRLATWFRRRGWKPQQVQCFMPTPGTIATAMFYARCDLDGKPLYVAASDREREDQHAALLPRKRS